VYGFLGRVPERGTNRLSKESFSPQVTEVASDSQRLLLVHVRRIEVCVEITKAIAPCSDMLARSMRGDGVNAQSLAPTQHHWLSEDGIDSSQRLDGLSH
jgi:hypothetical protein